MRNYIILNGTNSNTINGLLIQSLAPISKPLMRTEIEQIDGRDGDIITPLGFSAYDKQITVGLYGDFDINAIIAFFNSEGTVTFSNEPDKYYNYQIYDQIDFERLVRYRTATVTFHVQPFKFGTTGETQTLDAGDPVTGEGSNIVLEGTGEAPFNKLDPKGNAEQETLRGVNLIQSRQASGSANGITWTLNSDGSVRVSGTATANQTISFGSVSMVQGQTYTLSGCPSGGAVGKYMLYTNVVDPQFIDTGSGATHTVSTNATAQIYFIVYSGRTVDGTIYPQLEIGSTATSYEPYCGGVPSPNPDYPQEIKTVSGAQTVKITGKNLANLPQDSSLPIATQPYTILDFGEDRTITEGALTLFLTDAKYAQNTAALVDFRKDDGTHQYRTAPQFTGVLGTTGALPPNTVVSGAYSNKVQNLTFRKINIYLGSGYGAWTQGTANIQFEFGSATSFEPYQGQSYDIDLGSLELAKIGTYQDYIWNDDGTWKIHKAINKITLDGTENWALGSMFYCTSAIYSTAQSIIPTDGNIKSDYFTYSGGATNDPSIDIVNGYIIRIKDTSKATVSDLTTWLSTHNTTVYYALATPTDTEITDSELLAQLEALAEAHSYKNRTHITAIATGTNLPHIIEVEANGDASGTITNAGNIYSKPKLTVYGSGNIGIYLNGVQMFQVALGSDDYITIDTNLMEAYKDNLQTLMNRQVIGDYDNFKLPVGESTISFSGTVTKCIVENYSRWL